MARILDKDTRLIDIDFGPLTTSIQRLPNEVRPDGAPGNVGTISGAGEGSIIRFDSDTPATGSFIQYQRVDLSYMTQNGEAMQPVEVSVQRPNSAPFGTHENGNNYDPLLEYIFVLSRPLNNESLLGGNIYTVFAELGLDMGSSSFGGEGGGVSHAQNIYAEQRTYAWNTTMGATVGNGQLGPGNGALKSTFGRPALMDIVTWGSLSSIIGPNLHVYRIVYSQLQTFDAPFPIFENVEYGGFTSLRYPPLNITFLCKDPNFSEGQYLTRVYNAMSKTQEGEPTFD
jgi:hypothetical protein